MKQRRRTQAAQVHLGQYAFIKKGVPRFDFRDPYHLAVTLTWPQFFGALLSVYLLVNLIFATFYTLVPGSIANIRPYDFGHAFFFSFETLATVGYGEMVPGNVYGHVVTCVEIMTGVAFTAILTGLTFVRFSRPRAKFLFADKLVIAQHDDMPTLMARIGNGRPGVLENAIARMTVLVRGEHGSSARLRRAYDLRLQRSRNQVFPLTWTLMHTIDAKSPLYGLDRAGIIAEDARVFLSLEARDPRLSAVVSDIRVYGPEDILFGTRYVDAIHQAEDGTPIADMTKISLTEPDEGLAVEFVSWSQQDDDGDD